MLYGHWYYDDKIDVTQYSGFIYLIENLLNNKKYIGQKSFFKKNGKEHNWKYYTSSSKYLNKEIKYIGKHNFKFTVLLLSNNLDDDEYMMQQSYNVIYSTLETGEREYYNLSTHKRGFNINLIDLDARSRKIIQAKKDNKELLSKIDTNLYNFFNIKTGEHYINTAESLSLNYNLRLIDCIKLVNLQRQIVNGWVLIQDNIKLTSPNLDPKKYKILNLNTGEKFEGKRQSIISYIGTSVSALSTALNGNKYLKGWVFCNDDWQPLSNTVDKRISIAGNNHHRSDKKVYTLISKNNNIFTGTRYSIKSELGISTSLFCHLLNGKTKYAKGWSLIHNANINKKQICTGLSNSNSDKQIYKITNIDSGEVFVGTRFDIRNKINSNVQQTHQLIKKNKTINKWVIIG
jgi:hypothetical protein